MRAREAINKLLPFPGIDGEPKMHQESRYVESIKDKRKKNRVTACIFERVYYVAIESFYESGRFDSWVIVRTGNRSTPEAAMNEWNRLIKRVRKG